MINQTEKTRKAIALVDTYIEEARNMGGHDKDRVALFLSTILACIALFFSFASMFLQLRIWELLESIVGMSIVSLLQAPLFLALGIAIVFFISRSLDDETRRIKYAVKVTKVINLFLALKRDIIKKGFTGDLNILDANCHQKLSEEIYEKKI